MIKINSRSRFKILDSSKSEQTRNWHLKSQFTDKEFEALPDDIKSHNWEKIKVDREWSEMD